MHTYMNTYIHTSMHAYIHTYIHTYTHRTQIWKKNTQIKLSAKKKERQAIQDAKRVLKEKKRSDFLEEQRKREETLVTMERFTTDPAIVSQYVVRCCRNDFTTFRTSLSEDDKLMVTRGMLGSGRAAARVVMKLFQDDIKFMNEFNGHIRIIDERQKDLEQAFADAAADCFYDKSASEYRIVQHNFQKISQILLLPARKNVFPCHQYMLRIHEERNKVFTDMCTPQKKSTLTDEDLSNPVVTVDIAKYMTYIMGYKNAQLCIKDRSD